MKSFFLINKFTCLKVMIFLAMPLELVFGQDVFLRLTDYAGGKINLVIDSMDIQGTPKFIRYVKSIDRIIKYDLDYSLYFNLYSDTAVFAGDAAKSAVLLKISAEEPNLLIVLQDFQSKEKIGEFSLQISGDLRSLAHQISDYITLMLTGEKGITSAKIVFSYQSGEGKELALIDYDGYNFTPLTANGNFNLFPCWGSDGMRILYSNYGGDRLVLNLFDLTTRNSRAIFSYRGLNFAPDYSPDGTKIALTMSKDGNAEIYILDLEKKKLNRLTNNWAVDCSPVFSPNSREIAFVSDRSGMPQIYIMDVYGGNLRRLTFHGDYNTSPAWSPKGSLIAYVSRQSDYSQQIYVTDPGDFEPIQLTFYGNNEEPSWSPDGLHIVFISNRTYRYELWTMNWDGTRQRKLTRNIIAFAPDWSPYLE
jgi:tol-pal system beta propeller repeat protein TolB